MHGTDAVCVSRVRGSGKRLVSKPKLFNPAKSLKDPMVNNL
jgi:hypothetical protein